MSFVKYDLHGGKLLQLWDSNVHEIIRWIGSLS
jgi:hypothetical protein